MSKCRMPAAPRAMLYSALQAVTCATYPRQAYKSYGDPAKADRLSLFVLMATGSVVALALMRILKPKPKSKVT